MTVKLVAFFLVYLVGRVYGSPTSLVTGEVSPHRARAFASSHFYAISKSFFDHSAMRARVRLHVAVVLV